MDNTAQYMLSVLGSMFSWYWNPIFCSDPTPPGPISVVSQMTASINFTWNSPENMMDGDYNFSVSSINGIQQTGHKYFLLDGLDSGTLYNITVVTIGALNLMSTAVTAENYTSEWDRHTHSICWTTTCITFIAMLSNRFISTRWVIELLCTCPLMTVHCLVSPGPESVTRLRATEITTDSVTLVWEQPNSKSHYFYVVHATNGTNDMGTFTVNDTTAPVPGLRSGSGYNFTVTTETADGTAAASVTELIYTRMFTIYPIWGAVNPQ